MYLPNQFRASPDVTHEIIQRYSFGTLITSHEGAPYATHLPFIFDPDQGEQGVLLGHMARANHQWRDFHADQEVLAIFHGPHAYVSPSYYAGTLHVPTWNYVAAHAYGVPRVLNDSELLDVVARLVDLHEAGRPSPWNMDGVPKEFIDGLLRQIVGFAITVTRIEGKLKLSQNRSVEDREKATRELAAGPDASSRDTAAWMERLYGSVKP